MTPKSCFRRRCIRAVVATALAAAVFPATAPARSAVVAPVPALDWGPCAAGLERFLCATAEVPTDYDDPSGPKTRLALTKLPASGWGHTAIGKSACADAAVAAYLVEGTPPQDGAHCAPDTVPFTAQAAAPRTPRPDVPPGLPLW
jgi:hypothetical protein